MAELSPWMPWCHPQYSREEAEAWIKVTIEGHRRRTMYDFAIWADGDFAGACGLNKIDALDRVANVGYWIRTSKTRQGIATVAVSRLLQWGFINTQLNRLEIVAAVNNLPSQRVAEKVGAIREGILRKRLMVHDQPQDAFLYSVIRSQKPPP